MRMLQVNQRAPLWRQRVHVVAVLPVVLLVSLVFGLLEALTYPAETLSVAWKIWRGEYFELFGDAPQRSEDSREGE